MSRLGEEREEKEEASVLVDYAMVVGLNPRQDLATDFQLERDGEAEAAARAPGGRAALQRLGGRRGRGEAETEGERERNRKTERGGRRQRKERESVCVLCVGVCVCVCACVCVCVCLTETQIETQTWTQTQTQTHRQTDRQTEKKEEQTKNSGAQKRHQRTEESQWLQSAAERSRRLQWKDRNNAELRSGLHQGGGDAGAQPKSASEAAAAIDSEARAATGLDGGDAAQSTDSDGLETRVAT